jgi:hypothetical protein
VDGQNLLGAVRHGIADLIRQSGRKRGRGKACAGRL